MEHGLTTLSLIPGRSEASHRAQMSQQLIFGELYRVEDEKKDWLRIRTLHDDYPCWIERKQAFPLEKESFEHLARTQGRALPPFFRALDKDENSLNLVAGSLLHPQAISPYPIEIEDELVAGPLKPEGEDIVRTAKSFLRTPYLWGGRSPFGFDCSGFVQVILSLHGIFIQRDASDQVEEGVELDNLEECQAGDLAFFHNEKGRTVHVGILTKDRHIVHASGMVRVDPIDAKGIRPEGSDEHSHRLNALKRVIPA